MKLRAGTLVGVAVLAAATRLDVAEPSRRTENVVVIVTDGLRWQEVFRGAEAALIIDKPGGAKDPATLRRAYWRETAKERREALLPFLWTVVAKDGQIYGNVDAGSLAQVDNGYRFSYPGYNEILTGAADPRIDKNDYGPNPNVSVFEWLNAMPELSGRVGVVAGWDVFPAIFHRARSRLDMRSGWDPPVGGEATPRQDLLNSLYRTTTRVFPEMPFDAMLQQTLLDYVATRKPRVLFVGYGETDEWAHAGRYDLLLQSARAVDGFIQELWSAMQAMPEYKGTTTFLVTTDHGRGDGDENWKHHGREVEGAQNIWIAVLGPDTPPLGERKNAPRVRQSQIAATAAALLGKDWPAANPKAAPPLAEAIRP